MTKRIIETKKIQMKMDKNNYIYKENIGIIEEEKMIIQGKISKKRNTKLRKKN